MGRPILSLRFLLPALALALAWLPAAVAGGAAYEPGEYSDFGTGIQQVHLAQGKDPTSMVVSGW